MARLVLDFGKAQDLFNLVNDVYNPVKGFLRKEDFDSVLDNFCLLDGSVWSLPIFLDVRDSKLLNSDVLDLEHEGKVVGVLKNIEFFEFDKKRYAQKIFKTLDVSHPGVDRVFSSGNFLAGGDLEVADKNFLQVPREFLTPKQTRFEFERRGWKKISAFQTRNFPHLSHEFLQRQALELTDGILIQPIIGEKKKGDVRDEVIIGAYKELFKVSDFSKKIVFGILPASMNYAGPREALHHSLVRRNFGCTHMIVGRDHAGVGGFYASFEAQDIFDMFADGDLGVEVLKFGDTCYCGKCGKINWVKDCKHGRENHFSLSGTALREMIKRRETPSGKIIRKEVSDFLLKHNNPFVG